MVRLKARSETRPVASANITIVLLVLPQRSIQYNRQHIMVFTYRYKQRKNTQQQSSRSSERYDDEKKKELARFLFIGEDGQEISSSSLNKFDAFWYTLALEPMEVQNERCSKLLTLCLNGTLNTLLLSITANNPSIERTLYIIPCDIHKSWYLNALQYSEPY